MKCVRLLPIGALLATVLALPGCSKHKDGAFRTAKADRGKVTATVTATGTLSAVTTVQVGSQDSGIISRLYVDFNSRVKKGQLLAELDPTPFQQAVDQKDADLENAQVTAANTMIAFGRQKKLLKEGLSAQQDYDNAKAAADAAAAQVKLAQAALAQARTSLVYTKIISPVDGVVVNRAYDVGQTVAASFQAPTLFTIAQDLTKMQVEADVDESDIGKIKVGETAQFTVDAFPDKTFSAKVSQIRLNATVNQNVVTYPVMVDVANPGELLHPSMTANVTIEVATVEDALRIPNAALRFRPDPALVVWPGGHRPNGASGGPGGGNGMAMAAGNPLAGALPVKGAAHGPVVYEPAAGGKLTPVHIRAGITDGQFTELLGDHLKPGDVVVTGLATTQAGQQGMRVRF